MTAREVPETYLVAFSLAGEQRDLVRSVAEEVERRLGRGTVFLDEWYEHYIAGPDGDVKLQQIYLERCELAIACISERYGGKPWTVTEHAAIRARYMAATGNQAERDRVLPLRVGDGEVPGILLNTIAPDLRQKSVQEAAQLIVDRLALVRGATNNPEWAADQWPEEPPSLSWPMADHTEARTAFASQLTESSAVRLLCIAGPSDTGKSHMAAQMLSNCIRMPPLRCGRLDFKGTTEIGRSLAAFTRSLEVEMPPEAPLNRRLGDVLTKLKRSARPTVLILDTYEQAGEARAWVEDELLMELIRAPWLRVVILGQSDMPSRDGPWDSVASSPIRLTLPGPEDWWHYSKVHRQDEEVTLEFVAQAHRLVEGRPSVLASMLGPR